MCLFVGTYNGVTGRSSLSACLSCPAGRFNPSVGGESLNGACALCPPGTASGLTGVAECEACPSGQYQMVAGSYTCIFCPAGKFSEGLGAFGPAACINCPAGRSSNMPGAGLCTACAPGTYQPLTGRLECDRCVAGTYQPQVEAISAAECVPCPSSASQSAAGSTSILQCSTGITCDRGLYTAEGSSTFCIDPCPLGSWCIGGVAQSCPAGSYSNQRGSSICKPCGAGFASSVNGSSSVSQCRKCPLSTYSSAAISSSCVPCQAGSFTTTEGGTSAGDCIAMLDCSISSTLASQHSSAATAILCPLAARSAVPLSSLLPGGVSQMQNWLNRTQQLFARANSSSPSSGTRTAEAMKVQSAALAAAITSAYTTYVPLSRAESLRLLAFGSDATLNQYSATRAATVASKRADSTVSGLSSTTLLILICLVLAAFVPLILYRLMPLSWAKYIDQFGQSHQLVEGAVLRKQSTQFGAVLSWSFVCIAVLVALLLTSESNTVTTSELLPSSAPDLAGSATANWQITLRVYTGEDQSAMSSWCSSSNTQLIAREFGFSSTFRLVALPSIQSCDIAASCDNCGLSAAAVIAFSFPYSAQLIEFELWVNSATPKSWARRYGVITQLPGRLLDAESELQFSTLESFFTDERSGSKTSASGAQLSGFELNFDSYSPIVAQSINQFSALSTVQVNFRLLKSSILLQSRLSDKLSLLQLIVVVASSIVSLFSIFSIGFKIVEKYILLGFGCSPGPVHTDATNGNEVDSINNRSAMTSRTKSAGGVQPILISPRPTVTTTAIPQWDSPAGQPTLLHPSRSPTSRRIAFEHTAAENIQSPTNSHVVMTEFPPPSNVSVATPIIVSSPPVAGFYLASPSQTTPVDA